MLLLKIKENTKVTVKAYLDSYRSIHHKEMGVGMWKVFMLRSFLTPDYAVLCFEKLLVLKCMSSSILDLNTYLNAFRTLLKKSAAISRINWLLANICFYLI